MSNIYAVINSSNIVENIVLWDGNTDNWKPPSETIAVEVKDDLDVVIGMTYNSSGTGTGASNDNMWIYTADLISKNEET